MQAGGRAALAGGGAVRGRARRCLPATSTLGGHRIVHPQHRPGKRLHASAARTSGLIGTRAREARGSRASRAAPARSQTTALRAGQLRVALPALGATALHVSADTAHVGPGLSGTYAGKVSPTPITIQPSLNIMEQTYADSPTANRFSP